MDTKNKVYTPVPRNQIKLAHCTIFYQNCPFPTIDSIYLKSMWNFPGCHRPCRLEFQAVVRIKDFLLQKVNSLKKPKSGPPSSQASQVGGSFPLAGVPWISTQLYIAQNVSSRYMLMVYNYACTYNYYIYTRTYMQLMFSPNGTHVFCFPILSFPRWVYRRS